MSAFYLGYAHEALARAQRMSGNRQAFQAHYEKARELAAKVEDPEDRKLLETDLADLGSI